MESKAESVLTAQKKPEIHHPKILRRSKVWCCSERVRKLTMGDVCWCNVARILLPVQKTAALLTSRSLESWEEKGHLGFHCFFYLPSPAELQQPPVRPAHMVSFTGCFCHLLLPRPSSIPPHSQGNHNTIPCTQRGSAPSQQQPLSLPSTPSQWPLGHVDPVDCKAEEGRTPKQ